MELSRHSSIIWLFWAALVTVVILQYAVATTVNYGVVKHPYLVRTLFLPPGVAILIISPVPLSHPDFLALILSWLWRRCIFLEDPSNGTFSGPTARL